MVSLGGVDVLSWAEVTGGLLQGSKSERERVLEELAPHVFRYVFSRVKGDREAALDICQETLLSALRSHRFASRNAIPDEVLLITIARRRVIDHFRRKARARAEQPVFTHDPLERAEDRVVLLRALGSIPDHYAEILVLRYVSDLPVRDVAGILGTTPKSVEARLSRARRALREQLEEVPFHE